MATRMWADAQRNGRPAEYRRRRVLNLTRLFLLETARRLKSVEILSSAAQLYEKSHLTRRIALSCGIKISPVGSLDQSQSTRVTDGRTDRQTDKQNYDSQDRASTAASRGKNESHQSDTKWTSQFCSLQKIFSIMYTVSQEKGYHPTTNDISTIVERCQ